MDTFARQSLQRSVAPGNLPGLAAVTGDQDAEPTPDRVAQCNAVFPIEERDAVVERLPSPVFEHQLPGFAAIGGEIDLRVFAVTDRQHDGVVAVERLDVMKGRTFATWRGDVLPG